MAYTSEDRANIKRGICVDCATLPALPDATRCSLCRRRKNERERMRTDTRTRRLRRRLRRGTMSYVAFRLAIEGAAL